MQQSELYRDGERGKEEKTDDVIYNPSIKSEFPFAEV